MRRENAELRFYVEANSQEAARIDARGLPVVAVGILLTAAPEQLAAIPWVGWAVLVFSISLAAAVGAGTWRQYQSLRATKSETQKLTS
jgi:uncharacterized protein (DUF58 family)